jgi:peptide/nickel transport system substrate-binding protein
MLLLLLGSMTWDCAKREEVLAPNSFQEGSIADADRLNPILASDGASRDITGLVFNGLVKYDEQMNLVGELAESFEVSRDCLTAVFHLRKGVKWHDGVELTADDVLFTYEKLKDTRIVTPYSGDFETVKAVTALDRYAVKVEYKEPYAPGLEIWGLGIIPEHLLKDKDLNTDSFNRYPIGTGPFRFKEWSSGQKIVLTASDDYFEGRPPIDEYIYRIIPDTATMFLELKALKLDFMGLRAIQYRLQTDTGLFRRQFNKFQYPALGYTYLGYNLLNPKFSDIRVRRALSYAIDQQAIIDGVLFGLGRPATGPYIPESWAYNPDVKPYEYNPDKAKELLAEAGWEDTNQDGILDKDGQPFTFTILTNQGNEERRKTAEIVQQNLKKVGVDVEIRVVEWQAFLHEFVDKKRFDAIILGWGVGLDPDIYIIWHSSKTNEREFNHVSYNNPKVDALLIEGRQTCDKERRKAIYREVHRLIAEDQPYTFLYYPQALPIVHKRFKGVKPSPIGIKYNFDKWYVPKNRAEWYP